MAIAFYNDVGIDERLTLVVGDAAMDLGDGYARADFDSERGVGFLFLNKDGGSFYAVFDRLVAESDLEEEIERDILQVEGDSAGAFKGGSFTILVEDPIAGLLF